MNRDEFNDGLLGFLDASPTPQHAVQNISMMLDNAGFVELREGEEWSLSEGGSYYTTRGGGSLIAFNYYGVREYLLLGAHSDSPCLKLKPNAKLAENALTKLGVEPYGGLLLNTWFDRDLGIAGEIWYEDMRGELKSALVDSKRAVAVVASLAIHLDREANKDRSINAQNDLPPIIALDAEFDLESFLEDLVGDDVSKILSHDLSLYDTQKASFVGANSELITSARLDNLLSCYTALVSICSLMDKPVVVSIFDHEEVGSESLSGAGGSFFMDTLRGIFPAHSDYLSFAKSSLLLSLDNAHAVHQNFANKHDSAHTPLLNGGVVIKINSNQRYASSAKSVARFKRVAMKCGKSTQSFVTRSDMPCGSTIGPTLSALSGIATLDLGVPTLAMHSIRESAGSDDAHDLYEIILGFFS